MKQAARTVVGERSLDSYRKGPNMSFKAYESKLPAYPTGIAVNESPP